MWGYMNEGMGFCMGLGMALVWVALIALMRAARSGARNSSRRSATCKPDQGMMDACRSRAEKGGLEIDTVVFELCFPT